MEQSSLDLIFQDGEELNDPDGKRCSKCTSMLPLTSFSFTSGGNYLRAECRDCNRELTRIRVALREKHGMPPKEYCCPICTGTAEDVKGQGNTRNGPWVIDHCHETEKFRGWLCHKCNRALGGFNDDKDTLERAVSYLFNA